MTILDKITEVKLIVSQTRTKVPGLGKLSALIRDIEEYIKQNHMEKDKFIQPSPIKAGDKRVLVCGEPLNVDFRIISEENYQLLIGIYNKLKEIELK